jgi:hypothetical protein
MSIQNLEDPNGNRTRDLPTCSAVPQPTATPRNFRIKELMKLMKDKLLLFHNVIIELPERNLNA